jgi:CheY-like chemotaxis protein
LGFRNICTIFDPFMQGRAAGVETGVGLGLYICRQLMQAMGGELTLLERSIGAQFRLSLNLPLTMPSKPVPEAIALPAVRPLRILVVDDSEFNRLLLTAALERDGHVVSTADDGRAGVEAVLAQRFDAVLMDMRMPIMDGVEAVRLIRSSPGPYTDGLVIFALTANVMVEDVAEYRAVGVNEVIPKPIDLRRLSKALSEITPISAA